MNKIVLTGRDITFLTGVQSRLGLAGFQAELELDNSDLVKVIFSLKRQKPDYLVVELNNPLPYFLKLIKEAKHQDDLSHIPIFTFLSFTGPELQEQVSLAGSDYVFFKDDLNLDSFILSFQRIVKNKYKL